MKWLARYIDRLDICASNGSGQQQTHPSTQDKRHWLGPPFVANVHTDNKLTTQGPVCKHFAFLHHRRFLEAAHPKRFTFHRKGSDVTCPCRSHLISRLSVQVCSHGSQILNVLNAGSPHDHTPHFAPEICSIRIFAFSIRPQQLLQSEKRH